MVSLWSLFGLSLVSPWSLLVSPWSLFAPRDAVSFSKIIRRKTKNRRALEFGFAARRKKKNAAVAAVVSFVVPVKKENATKSALRVLCSFISPQLVSSLRASSILTSCVRSRRHFSFVTSSTLRRTTRRARTRSARRDGRGGAFFFAPRRLTRRGFATGDGISDRISDRITRPRLERCRCHRLVLRSAFFPDDGERFPRRRVSRARPENGTRGFEAPARRKNSTRGILIAPLMTMTTGSTYELVLSPGSSSSGASSSPAEARERREA